MRDSNVQSVLNKQRLDKFRLVLTLPPILRELNTSNWSVMEQDIINRDSLQFSLYSATLPDVSVPSKSLPTMGQTVKVTSQSRESYPAVTCKYVVDNRFKNYWVLWKWLETMNDSRHSLMNDELANPKKYWNYQTMISIFPLDEYNKSMCEFKFFNAFPTKLSGIDFSYQNPEQLEGTFSFDFGQMDIVLTMEET